MKRVVPFLLYITIFFMICTGAVTTVSSETSLMYAEDGRTLSVKNSEVKLYESVGWFLGPVTLMHAPGNRTLTVRNTEIKLYESLGWYLEPVSTMYAIDGRTLVVKNTEIELYKTVGWYESPEDFPKKYIKMVALTFDDGPGPYTDRILDCLESHGAKATFFVIGRNVSSYPNALKRAHDLGMQIGNHTMNHPRLTRVSTSRIRSEIDQTASAVQSVTGSVPTILRPPYGSYNSTVKSAGNIPLILWSIDTLDWKTKNADKTVSAVLSEVKDGSVVLMHDIHASTADAVVRLVPELIKRGYSLVTVSELAEAKGYNLQNGEAYRSFYLK